MDISQVKRYEPQPYKYPQISLLPVTDLGSEAGNVFVFDIEVFPNYFLCGMRSIKTGRVIFFEVKENEGLDRASLNWILDNCTLVGFNSKHYDLPVLWAAKEGLKNATLFELSSFIISENPSVWQIEKRFKFKMGFSNHIDIQQVAPSAAAFCSLKHYAARMHSPTIRELNGEFTKYIDDNERPIVKSYNVNDLLITEDLYKQLQAAIDLRQEMGMMYGEDLRSLSDAQIAEKCIGTEMLALTGKKPERPSIQPGTAIQFKNPDYVKFYSESLQRLHRDILGTVFVINDKGYVRALKDGCSVPATNLWSINIGNTTYRLGIGGLHSSESQATHISDNRYVLLDRDVASYYPNIILNQKLYPSHLGKNFLKVYSDIVSRRLIAKEKGEKTTADSLKICINGCFGKLGSKWSIFYSPDLLIQVTLSGQLSLLMLIEMLEYYNISVVSANTDGIVIKCPRNKWKEYKFVIQKWQEITNFKTDETQYRSLHSRDVNNYIAITNDGKFKAKGAYVNELSMKEVKRESLMKNPIGSICSEAAMLWLRDETPVDETILHCRDVRKFVFCRRVKGKAKKDGHVIGKIVRWYVGASEYGSIYDALSGNQVAESVGAVPLMQLNEMPTDIDYDWYINRANRILRDIGIGVTKNNQLELF